MNILKRFCMNISPPRTITVTITPDDCKDSDYVNNHDYGLARALKKLGYFTVNVGPCSAGVGFLWTNYNDFYFSHEYFCKVKEGTPLTLTLKRS